MHEIQEIKLTREEALDQIADSKLRAIEHNFSDIREWLRTVLIDGYAGLDDYSNQELMDDMNNELNPEINYIIEG